MSHTANDSDEANGERPLVGQAGCVSYPLDKRSRHGGTTRWLSGAMWPVSHVSGIAGLHGRVVAPTRPHTATAAISPQRQAEMGMASPDLTDLMCAELKASHGSLGGGSTLPHSLHVGCMSLAV